MRGMRGKKGLDAASRMADLFKSIVSKLDSESLPDALPAPGKEDMVSPPSSDS